MPTTTMPRLVASDLDGTLLRDDKTISNRTCHMLRRLNDLGIAFVPVTGRPPRTLGEVMDVLSYRGTVICQNGALVLDHGRDEILRHAAIPAGAASAFVRVMRERAPGIAFGCEMGRAFGCEPGYEQLRPYARSAEPWRADALDLCAAPLTKLLAAHPTLPLADLYALAHEVAGDTLTCTHSGLAFVEISAAGVDKASGLRWLCARLGIDPRTVVAFGDMPNDLAMLCWAGRGIAVANAHPDVLAGADAATLSNNEDGVAVALESLLGGTA